MLEKRPPNKKPKAAKVVKAAKKKTPAKKQSKSKKKTAAKKPQGTSQMKLISIYVILGILFLGYIFYHTSIK